MKVEILKAVVKQNKSERLNKLTEPQGYAIFNKLQERHDDSKTTIMREFQKFFS